VTAVSVGDELVVNVNFSMEDILVELFDIGEEGSDSEKWLVYDRVGDNVGVVTRCVCVEVDDDGSTEEGCPTRDAVSYIVDEENVSEVGNTLDVSEEVKASLFVPKAELHCVGTVVSDVEVLPTELFEKVINLLKSVTVPGSGFGVEDPLKFVDTGCVVDGLRVAKGGDNVADVLCEDSTYTNSAAIVFVSVAHASVVLTAGIIIVPVARVVVDCGTGTIGVSVPAKGLVSFKPIKPELTEIYLWILLQYSSNFHCQQCELSSKASSE
jgi:hypothetical protein